MDQFWYFLLRFRSCLWDAYAKSNRLGYLSKSILSWVLTWFSRTFWSLFKKSLKSTSWSQVYTKLLDKTNRNFDGSSQKMHHHYRPQESSFRQIQRFLASSGLQKHKTKWTKPKWLKQTTSRSEQQLHVNQRVRLLCQLHGRHFTFKTCVVFSISLSLHERRLWLWREFQTNG